MLSDVRGPYLSSVISHFFLSCRGLSATDLAQRYNLFLDTQMVEVHDSC